MTPLLDVDDLRVSFRVPGGTTDVIKGVSFTVQEGKTVALVGESGSGKSVISQAVMGILPRNGFVTSGSITFNDPAATPQMASSLDLTKLDPEGSAYRDIRGGRISIIFQEPMTSLSPLHTIGNQISEAVLLHRTVGKAEALDISREMLAHVGFPSPSTALSTYPFQLSGGLRQRAMIAMALVCNPALLIADEPTTALDVTIQAQILKLIKDMQSALRMAVMMITHDLGVVANVADEIVVLYRGEVMERGSLDDIFLRAEHPYLKALLNAVPRFHMKDGERLQPIREIEVTSSSLFTGERRTGEAGEPILKVQGLSKTFRTRNIGIRSEMRVVHAVNDVSFTLRRGECLGLVGESGCGKTTLSKILMRALSPDTGTVTYCGQQEHDVLGLTGSPLKDFRRKIQFIFQDPFGSLNPRMTVFNIVTEPLVIHGIGSPAERRELAKDLMSLVGLDVRHLQRYPHSFSGGQRQRIGIARALALAPDIIICDEPVSALDVSVQAQVLNLLSDLREKMGLTYIFISHNLAVVDYIADRIMVMCAGMVVEIAPREVLFRDPRHPYTKALLAAVPYPDPDHPLNLQALMDDRASDPTAWPQPFGLTPDDPLSLIDLGEDHWVRAEESMIQLETA